jgi:DNA-binding transcriptional MerR regulator
MLPLADVARQAGVSEGALRQRARRGGLPIVRSGRRLFVDKDVAALVIELHRLLRELDRRAAGAAGPAAAEVRR